MKKSTDTIAFLNRLLYAGTFSVIMLFCFSDWLGISGVNWKHMAVLLVTTVVFSAVCLLSGRQRIYAAVLGIFVFLFLFLSIGSERCLMFLGKVLDLPFSRGEIPAGEQVYIELGRIFLLTVVCSLAQLFPGKNIYLKIASADAVGGWMLYMQKVPKMGVVFFILYIGLIAAEWVRSRRKKMKSENARAYVLSILPFLVVYVVLLSFMPMQEKPYDWQWAKNIYRSAEEKLTMYAENLGNIGSEYFGETTSGFSGEGGFFPNILQDNRQLMTLGIGRQKDMPVYLTGKVFDSFNGREWENLRENGNGTRNNPRGDIEQSERVLDVLETVCALESYAGSDARDYYKNVEMDVSYQYFHTNYLLAPSKTWKIEDRDKRVKYHQEGINFVFDRKAGYGTEYTLRFCQLNMGREELYRFLEWSGSDDAEYLEIWTAISRQYSGKRIPMEELYAYRETVKEQYLPETVISPEVEEWLAFVTADAKTDVEKLKYIESALSGMAYNTSPGMLPETVTDERSFLDYFLLEKREGYCAHFATVFVLLARAEGFPARYVQGFCVPEVSGEGTPVYSDMAHAWPEVYVGGKGWIPFEPTPGFGVNRYVVWEENTRSDGWSSYTGNPGYQAQENVSASEGEMPDENVQGENMQEEQSLNRFLPYLLRVILILLIGSILAFIIDRLLEKYREKKRDLGEKYRLAVLHNLQILDMLGYKRELSETYHELAQRIRQGNSGTDREKDADRDDKEDVTKGGNAVSYDFMETYEKHLYGTLEIDEQIINEVLAERTQLFAQLKKYRRKTYLLCRVRLYIMRYR